MQAGDIKIFQGAKKPMRVTEGSEYDYDSNDDCNTSGADLDSLQLNTAPAQGNWIEVEDGVQLMRCAAVLPTPPTQQQFTPGPPDLNASQHVSVSGAEHGLCM